MQSRSDAQISFWNVLRHELVRIINECWEFGWIRQFDCRSNIANMAVEVVFARVAEKPARLAEAGVVYQIPYYPFCKFTAVNEDQC
jgi:hypothetical protein